MTPKFDNLCKEWYTSEIDPTISLPIQPDEALISKEDKEVKERRDEIMQLFWARSENFANREEFIENDRRLKQLVTIARRRGEFTAIEVELKKMDPQLAARELPQIKRETFK